MTWHQLDWSRACPGVRPACSGEQSLHRFSATICVLSHADKDFPMSISTLIFLAVLAALIFYVIGIYNQLVTLRNRFQNGFAQIEVQLKRRYDLIPNLVETAKGYIAHERETLEAVIAARNNAVTGLKAASAQPGNAQ